MTTRSIDPSNPAQMAAVGASGWYPAARKAVQGGASSVQITQVHCTPVQWYEAVDEVSFASNDTLGAVAPAQPPPIPPGESNATTSGAAADSTGNLDGTSLRSGQMPPTSTHKSGQLSGTSSAQLSLTLSTPFELTYGPATVTITPEVSFSPTMQLQFEKKAWTLLPTLVDARLIGSVGAGFDVRGTLGAGQDVQFTKTLWSHEFSCGPAGTPCVIYVGVPIVYVPSIKVDMKFGMQRSVEVDFEAGYHLKNEGSTLGVRYTYEQGLEAIVSAGAMTSTVQIPTFQTKCSASVSVGIEATFGVELFETAKVGVTAGYELETVQQIPAPAEWKGQPTECTCTRTSTGSDAINGLSGQGDIKLSAGIWWLPIGPKVVPVAETSPATRIQCEHLDFAVSGCPAAPSYRMSGALTDAASANPIEGATVRLVDLDRTATTTSQGVFTFESVP